MKLSGASIVVNTTKAGLHAYMDGTLVATAKKTKQAVTVTTVRTHPCFDPGCIRPMFVTVTVTHANVNSIRR